jgi:hypothetical protein
VSSAQEDGSDVHEGTGESAAVKELVGGDDEPVELSDESFESFLVFFLEYLSTTSLL